MEDMEMKARFAAKVREAGELMVEKCGRSFILNELASECASCGKSIHKVFEAVDNGTKEQKVIAGNDLIYKAACLETALNIMVEFVLTENDRKFYEEVRYIVPDYFKDAINEIAVNREEEADEGSENANGHHEGE